MEENTTIDINEIYKLEDKGYKDSMQKLDVTILIKEIINLYDPLTKIQNFLLKDEKANYEIIALQTFINHAYLLDCKSRFISTCFSAFRGHFSDSLILLRIAIEACACAYRIKKRSHLAKVILESVNSNQKYKEYINKFKTSELFPAQLIHPIMNELHKRYKECSKRAHSNIVSMALSIKFPINHNKLIEKDYFEYNKAGPTGVAWHLFYIIDTHIGILQIFDEVFKDIIDFNRKNWLINLKQVKNKTSLHIKNWPELINKENWFFISAPSSDTDSPRNKPRL